MNKIIKSSRIKKASTLGLLVMALGYQGSVYAAAQIHFSKHRFVFDDAARKDSLQLSNHGKLPADCVLSTTHFIMSEKGPVKLATSPNDVANPAESLLRYSPRRVTIIPGNSQTVRLASRRRPNVKDGEYVSYLKLLCREHDAPDQQQDAQITIKPTFNYFIPLQVRIGKLNAATRFDNIKLNSTKGNHAVSFTQHREGTRSIVGKLEVREQQSGKVLGQLNNSVIYVPFNKKEHLIQLNSAPKGPLEIVFTEDKSDRGDINARAAIN